MKRNWKEDIHDRLGNFETDAPDGLWEAIHQRMAQTEPAQAEKRQTPFVLQPALRRTACAAAACLALIAGYQYFGDGGKETVSGVKQAGVNGMIAVGGTVASDNSRYVASKPATASIVATNLAGVRVAKNGVTPAADAAVLPTQNDESAQISTSQHLNTSTSQHPNPSTSQHLNPSTSQHLNPSTSQHLNPSTSQHLNPSTSQPHNPSTPQLAYTPVENSRGRHEGAAARWTLSTSATTGMGASSVTNSTATYVEAVGPDDVMWADNPQLGIGIFNQGKSVKTEYKHRLPVRVGINVAYRLTDRLSVESGVSYTRLSSDMKDGTKDNYSSSSQKLDYIGVPLNVKYRAFGYRRLSVYASAGLLTEKCVSGKATHEYVISGEKKKHEADDVAEKPWQLSVNAALGAQFDVLRNVGVYVEPGVSYYFDDRSPLSTIYKEKPLNFNLNLGVRYTIGK
ncbi:outer membrane beta-barrel protein [Prevotella stercorea]|uniref:outer membrane beta-barrel protein n=1 Tax=Leyella stercorea TaxID=363265 RepID=UPI001C2CABA0|nr:outer membrane beta-barrel protein [Leyella stercorea]MBU9897281.1 outer membrane beta-barrel protein [Leyella stercorea]MBU9945536.1 outer membrane beta-barrel protein [Leyella stercorea]